MFDRIYRIKWIIYLSSQFPPGRLALLGTPSEEGARTWSPSGILAWLALPLLQDFIFTDIIIDLRRMNKIVKIDEKNLYAVVGTHLERQKVPKGSSLFFP